MWEAMRYGRSSGLVDLKTLLTVLTLKIVCNSGHVTLCILALIFLSIKELNELSQSFFLALKLGFCILYRDLDPLFSKETNEIIFLQSQYMEVFFSSCLLEVRTITLYAKSSLTDNKYLLKRTRTWQRREMSLVEKSLRKFWRENHARTSLVKRRFGCGKNGLPTVLLQNVPWTLCNRCTFDRLCVMYVPVESSIRLFYFAYYCRKVYF